MNEAASLDSYLFHRDSRDQFDDGSTALDPHEGQRPDEALIPARDGALLAASVFRSTLTVDSARGTSAAGHGDASASFSNAIVIAPATGVKRKYYAAFARYLARQGYDVVTFDYRGIGGSRAASEAPRMTEWGELDLAGVVDWAAEHLDRRTHDAASMRAVSVVGHSVGGQLVGLLPNVERVERIVTIGSQSGDYRLWPMPSRLGMALVMHAVIPAVTHTIGYFPGKLGTGEDLPAGVALEWARWCRTPGYFTGGDGPARPARFARVTAPLLAFGFDDDHYAPRAAVDALLALYENADVVRRQLPAGKRRIGHFGFFRRRFETSLWPEVAAFLGRKSR